MCCEVSTPNIPYCPHRDEIARRDAKLQQYEQQLLRQNELVRTLTNAMKDMEDVVHKLGVKLDLQI